MNNAIDFVVLWVDNSDLRWQNDFAKYKSEAIQRDNESIGVIRYSEHGLLPFWFRGVEKFTPWVRTVHFVTNGQYPKWLNLACPKLHFVKHPDFIDRQFLPVFNSTVIESNIYKIDGLAEKFVYFNDDMYITAPTEQLFFFKDNLPCDAAILTKAKHDRNDTYFSCVENDLMLINDKFNKNRVMINNLSKWFSLKYKLKPLLNLLWMLTVSKFPGFKDNHSAQAFLKTTFKNVWEAYNKELVEASKYKFRSIYDLNQYLFKYWQLVSGDFTPAPLHKDRAYFDVKTDIKSLIECLLTQSAKVVCIEDEEDAEEEYKRVRDVFEKILPSKSSFEL